jgi:hypothetical protein
MHYRVIYLALLFAATLLNGISRAEATKPPDSLGVFALPIGYEDILKDYRQQFTCMSKVEKSASHWNHWVVVYINKNAEVFSENHLEYFKWYVSESNTPGEKKKFKEYPVGTVVLKEHFTSSDGPYGKPAMLAFMIKHPKGYDSKMGDWQFVWASADGKILLQGKATSPPVHTACGECHANARERDYVFSNYAKDLLP